MRSRNRFFAICSIAIGVLIGLAFVAAWLRQEGFPARTKPRLLRPSSAQPPTGGTAVRPGASHTARDETERTSLLAAVANTPIDFYGKVVDQNGVPVTGATTHFIVGSLSLGGTPTRQGPTTDNEGRFSISGEHGPDLSVWVEHSEYYSAESAIRRFDYFRRSYAKGKGPEPVPTEQNPAIFVLKRKGNGQPLVHRRKIEARLPLDGTPVTVDLISGSTGGGEHSIQLALHSDGGSLPLNTFSPFDWNLTISIPGGGIAERSNKLDFEAPADSYRDSVTLKMTAIDGKRNWTSRLEQELFVKLGSGLYGRMRLFVSGESGACSIDSYVNPSGSRDLESESGDAQ